MSGATSELPTDSCVICTGMSAKAWRRASSARRARIWRLSKKTMVRVTSKKDYAADMLLRVFAEEVGSDTVEDSGEGEEADEY